jgi:hypothetical protein
MAEDSEDRRFMGGPRPIGALVPRLTRPAFRRRSPAGATLMTEWPTIVGPALAAVTEPQRFAAGTLTIACAGPVAMELAHLAPQLLGRINGQLGQALVQRLRFVQRRAASPAPGRRAIPDAAAPPPPLPGPVAAALEEVPDEDLRAALAKLGRGVYRSGS